MKNHDRLKIALFVSLSVMFSLIGFHVPAWMGMAADNLFTPFVQLLFYSWGPALAVMFLINLMYGGDLASLGFSRKKMTFKWLFSAMAAPIAFVLSMIGLVFILGNLFHLPGFGQVIFSETSINTVPLLNVLESFGDVNAMMPQEMWITAGLILLLGTIWGATISLLFNLSEELGFRGFLLRELQGMGFIGSNFIIGALQGIWYLPLLMLSVPDLFGANIWYVPTTIGYSIALAFPAAYLSLKGKSIYTSAIFIGILNIVGQLTYFFIWGEEVLLASPRGLTGMLILLGATYLILRWDKDFVDNYASLRYEPEASEIEEIPIEEEEAADEEDEEQK